MNENLENAQHSEELTPIFEVIPVSGAETWKSLLSFYEQEGRPITYSEMNGYAIHQEDEVIVNRGAAPCVIIITNKSSEHVIGSGHYIVGDGDYEEYLSWVAQSSNPEAREVYIFGQAFPTGNASFSDTYEIRETAMNDLLTKGQLEKSQIHDYREKDPQKSGTDNVIIDSLQKRIYLFRLKRK
jgi:hypothetical protein